jgi:hypothetical protein
MTLTLRNSAVLAAALLGLLPVTGAQAQWYSSYPQAQGGYGAQPPQSYAVEVSPNTYVIHRPDKTRATTRVRCVKDCDQPASERPRSHANRELIEELVKRHKKREGTVSTEVINTTKVVRRKPVVIEHERLVDDPPRVIERRHITEDAPGRGLIKQRREVGHEDVVIEPGGAPSQPKRSAKAKRALREAKTNEPKESVGKRVIRAEAEVTILGPDRMSIRLFRKGQKARDANAEVIE